MDIEEPTGINSNSSASEDEIKLLQPEGPADTVADEEDDVDEQTTKVDDELSGASNDSERAQIQERRRAERKNRKERARTKSDDMQRRMDALAEQNRQLQARLTTQESHTNGAQLAQLTNSETEAVRAIAHFKSALSDAATRGDGAVVAEATDKLLQAQAYLTNVRVAKDNFERQVRTPQSPQLDPTMVNHAKKFMGAHSWFKGSQATDPDSRVLAAIDNSLAAEQWDPTTEAYWSELEIRAAKYLPHRFNKTNHRSTTEGSYNDTNNANDSATAGSPVAGSSAGSSSINRKASGYTVSAERVKAMKDAGIWDDPKRRADMIKRYQETDRSSNS